jgi:hypothetical protein
VNWYSQNYFILQNKIYEPEKALSIGSSISSTIAEIFLQCLEETHINLIIRKDSNLEIHIHWKPTTTNTTINFLLNHPMEHKIATYRHHITRMQSLPPTPKWKQHEWSLIQLIAQSNNFPQKLIQNLEHQIQCKRTNQEYVDKNKKLFTFTYDNPKVRKITNVFKPSNIRIALKTTNTLQQLTNEKQTSSTQELDKSSIYKLSCNTCQMAYVGQTCRNLRQS